MPLSFLVYSCSPDWVQSLKLAGNTTLLSYLTRFSRTYHIAPLEACSGIFLKSFFRGYQISTDFTNIYNSESNLRKFSPSNSFSMISSSSVL